MDNNLIATLTSLAYLTHSTLTYMHAHDTHIPAHMSDVTHWMTTNQTWYSHMVLHNVMHTEIYTIFLLFLSNVIKGTKRSYILENSFSTLLYRLLLNYTLF